MNLRSIFNDCSTERKEMERENVVETFAEDQTVGVGGEG